MTVLPSYRNHSIDLLCKSIDWFLYECNTGINRSNTSSRKSSRFIAGKKYDICFCNAETVTAQKMKFSIKDLFSKCHQIRRRLRIWSHLLNKALMKNVIFFVQCCYYIIYLFTISLSISLCFPYTSKAPQ